jgi:hypothetical protein
MSYRNTVTGSLTASGTAAANYVRADCRHQVPVMASFQLTGTFVGTVLLEATLDGTNWETCDFVKSTASGTLVASATVVGLYSSPGNVPLPLAYRVRCSAFTSGSIDVILTLLPVG